MTRGCVVGGCDNRYCDSLLPKQQRKRISLHGWPKDDPKRAAKWTKFVNSTRKFWKGPTASSTICGDHFVAPDDFVGYRPWVSGHRDRLDLQPHAIPTIKPAAVKLNVQSAQQGSKVCRCDPGPSDPSTPKRRKSTALIKLKLQRMVSTLPQTPASNTSESTTATTISEAVASSTNEVTNPFYQPHPNVWSLHPAETKVETVDKPIVEPVVTSQLPAETKVQTIDHPNFKSLHPAKTEVETMDHPILQLMSLHPAKTKVEAVNHVDIFRSVKHVGCQTEVGVLARRKTVGTQVSLRTLTKRRDRASQVKVRCQDLGVGTTTVPLDRLQIFIQPTVTETSPKRPRLSLQREDCG
ncbi:uncharacterized protein LOC117514648 isoform X2 [Thalassophryne amazonica]|uniref:uncharacterized protein LOC117514648 isoform X2 n=1 Tax=Thalassophryne amazonica TaxID=390379 RepID=UPI001471D9EC|nr:uncharacterized protein LOC117514648 isoform X2 [Thalassophryne amazonica]